MTAVRKWHPWLLTSKIERFDRECVDTWSRCWRNWEWHSTIPLIVGWRAITEMPSPRAPKLTSLWLLRNPDAFGISLAGSRKAHREETTVNDFVSSHRTLPSELLWKLLGLTQNSMSGHIALGLFWQEEKQDRNQVLFFERELSCQCEKRLDLSYPHASRTEIRNIYTSGIPLPEREPSRWPLVHQSVGQFGDCRSFDHQVSASTPTVIILRWKASCIQGSKTDFFELSFWPAAQKQEPFIDYKKKIPINLGNNLAFYPAFPKSSLTLKIWFFWNWIGALKTGRISVATNPRIHLLGITVRYFTPDKLFSKWKIPMSEKTKSRKYSNPRASFGK